MSKLDAIDFLLIGALSCGSLVAFAAGSVALIDYRKRILGGLLLALSAVALVYLSFILWEVQ